MDKPLFNLILLREAEEFITALPEKVQDKVFFNIRKVRLGIKNLNLFKKLGNTHIWEFRTSYQDMTYRLFAFWDKEKETLVIATHGLIKKSQKTPKRDIEKAETIRKEWFNNKNK